MPLKLRKLDAIIIVALIIIAGLVLIRAEIWEPEKPVETPEIEFRQDDENKKIIIESTSKNVLWEDIEIQGRCDTSLLGEYVIEGDEITQCEETINLIYKPTRDLLYSVTFTPNEIPPESFFNDRTVYPKDEGDHFDDILVTREWWYYSVIFSKDCELAGWTLTVSFNHMSRTDLFFSKPDILFVSLTSPDGQKYGGIVEKSRPLFGSLNPLKDPVLQVVSSEDNFKVSFEKSYAQGHAPTWFLHVEGDEIDSKHDIVIDLQYTAGSSPFWTHNTRLIDNSKAKIASYVFLGCEVKGTVNIDGFSYSVNGWGQHEHTWASAFLLKSFIRGWDWHHITCDNGWEIYYNNYMMLPQIKSTKETKINPFSTLFITTDRGETITSLENLEIEVTQSEKISLLLNIPTEIHITGRPSSTQLLLKDLNVKLDLTIKNDNTLDKIWKKLTDTIEMKIGRTTATGTISWKDEYGEHSVELQGIGTNWEMRH